MEIALKQEFLASYLNLILLDINENQEDHFTRSIQSILMKILCEFCENICPDWLMPER